MSVVVPIADLHCGSRSGITPPDWQWPLRGERKRWGEVQRATWKAYKDMQQAILKEYGDPDIVIWMGDLIDGPSSKTKGSTLVTTDVIEQATMAATALLGWRGKKYFGVYGTGYHTGNEADWEKVVASVVEKEEGKEVDIRSKLFLKKDGHVLQCKHHGGDSTSPYGWGTPLTKEWLANLLWWRNDNMVPEADIFIHAHVHAYRRVGSFSGHPWHSVSLPGLQAAIPDLGSTRYARRLGLRVVHWGIVPIVLEPQLVRFDTRWITAVKPAKAEVINLDGNNYTGM
jgi:hypothetical protein